jgi:hypothetical protein
MAQINDKFTLLNLVRSQQYAMLQSCNLKQALHQYEKKRKRGGIRRSSTIT